VVARVRSERGAAAVVVAAALVLAALVMGGAARLATVAVAAARARTAADAAALAAADALALGRGPSAARSAAAATADANGAHLVRCECTGRVVEVAVARAFVGFLGVRDDVLVRARAEIRPPMSLLRRKGGWHHTPWSSYNMTRRN
jgi:secretion/DNA translocation related TadE-like protein